MPRWPGSLLCCATLLVGGRSAADDGPTRLLANMEDWSNALGGGLRSLTLDLVDMRFDLRRHAARVSLGGGQALPLRVDSNIVLRDDGYARVRARLDLELGGSCLTFHLPLFDVAPQEVNGQRAVIVRVPIFEQSF